MRDIERYGSEYVKDELGSKFERDYQVKFRKRKIKELMEGLNHKRILEVSCGMEPFATCVDSFDEYTIVEPNKKFIEHAKEQLIGKEIMYVEGFFEEQVEALSKRSYDFIIISGLLNEVENPGLLLKIGAELSEPGKTIIHVNVPNAKSIHKLIAKCGGMIESEYQMSERSILFQQHSVFDMDMLKQLSEENGLSVVDSGSYFIKPFKHNQMQTLIEERIISEEVLEGLYNLERYLPEYGSEIYVNLIKK